jgi:hypothetical protein
MSKNEIMIATTLIASILLWAVAMVKVKEVYSMSMKSMCRADMIAAEVSKLDRGIAVDLYKFTGGRSAEEMKDLPQCKGASHD